MPSGYMVIYTGDAKDVQVLVAAKNEVAAWHSYNPKNRTFEDWQCHLSKVPLPAPIRNNPGQPVFLGGAVKDDETMRQAAVREFREETGVELRDFKKPEAVQNRYFIDKGDGTAPIGYDKEPENYSFGVVYLKLDKQSFDTVIQDATNNINHNTALHNQVVQYYSNYMIYYNNKWKHVQEELQKNGKFQRHCKSLPGTVDDELKSVQSMDLATAKSTIEGKSTEKDPTGWFVESLEYLASITKDTSQSPQNTQVISPAKDTTKSDKQEV